MQWQKRPSWAFLEILRLNMWFIFHIDPFVPLRPVDPIRCQSGPLTQFAWRRNLFWAKTSLKTCITPYKPKNFSLIFLVLVTLDGLDLKCVYQNLRMALSEPSWDYGDTIYTDLFCFHLIWLWTRQIKHKKLSNISTVSWPVTYLWTEVMKLGFPP